MLTYIYWFMALGWFGYCMGSDKDKTFTPAYLIVALLWPLMLPITIGVKVGEWVEK